MALSHTSPPQRLSLITCLKESSFHSSTAAPMHVSTITLILFSSEHLSPFGITGHIDYFSDYCWSSPQKVNSARQALCLFCHCGPSTKDPAWHITDAP